MTSSQSSNENMKLYCNFEMNDHSSERNQLNSLKESYLPLCIYTYKTYRALIYLSTFSRYIQRSHSYVNLKWFWGIKVNTKVTKSTPPMQQPLSSREHESLK